MLHTVLCNPSLETFFSDVKQVIGQYQIVFEKRYICMTSQYPFIPSSSLSFNSFNRNTPKTVYTTQGDKNE